MKTIQEYCKQAGITLTDLGKYCYPELSAKRAYMKIYGTFTRQPKYVEIDFLRKCSEKLGLSITKIIDLISPGTSQYIFPDPS